MMNLRRLLRNVPVPRFGAASILAVLIATSALLGTPALFGPPALAAETLDTDLPAGLSPEQAETARKYLESNPEARKAFEAAQQQKEQDAREGVKPGDGNAEGGKKDLAPGAEGAAAAAKEDRFAPFRSPAEVAAHVCSLGQLRIVIP